MIKAAKEMSGVDFPVEFGARRPGDPGTVLADASLAKQVLNWEPKYSDLENIIKTTLSVYKKNNK
jgi:UDP-glucose 4-epimerase